MTCSIRNRIWIVKVAVGCIAVSQMIGCAVKQPIPPEPVSHAPLEVDEAMQLRQDWSLSVVHYANGQTVGWPTDLLLEPKTRPAWSAAVTDTPLFVANCVAMPIVLLFAPPWQPVIYPRGEIEASYHAMPPLTNN